MKTPSSHLVVAYAALGTIILCLLMFIQLQCYLSKCENVLNFEYFSIQFSC